MNEHSQRTSWALQLRFLAMSHTEGSSAKIVKVVKFHLCDIYDVSPDFGPTQRLFSNVFAVSARTHSLHCQPCSSKVGFRKFPKPQQLLGKECGPSQWDSSFRASFGFGRILFRFGNRPVLIVEICVENVIDNVSYSTLFYYDQYSM